MPDKHVVKASAPQHDKFKHDLFSNQDGIHIIPKVRTLRLCAVIICILLSCSGGVNPSLAQAIQATQTAETPNQPVSYKQTGSTHSQESHSSKIKSSDISTSEINTPPPAPKGLSIYVNDYANLLIAADKMRLQRKLQTLDEAGIAQVSVLILPDTVRELSEFAPEIMNAWDIQHYKRKDGLLILVNAQRLLAGESGNRIFAAPGYRLESILPDAMIGRILDTKALPAFENGNYSGGITETTLTMADILAGDKELRKAYTPHNAHNPDWMIILFIVVLFIMVSNVLNRQRRRRGSGGVFDSGGGGYYGGGGFGGGFGGGGDSSGGGGSGR